MLAENGRVGKFRIAVEHFVFDSEAGQCSQSRTGGVAGTGFAVLVFHADDPLVWVLKWKAILAGWLLRYSTHP